MAEPIKLKLYDALVETRKKLRENKGFSVPLTTLEEYKRLLDKRHSSGAGQGVGIKRHPALLSQMLEGDLAITALEFYEEHPEKVTDHEVQMLEELVLAYNPQLKERFENAKRKNSTPSPRL